MNTITQRVTIGEDHHIRIELDVPPDFPVGEAEAIVNLKSLSGEVKSRNRIHNICGKGKGKFWMADDFDEPLEDFANYM